MADVTISGLSQGVPNKDSAVIPYSDGSTTYKTSPAGIVAASPGSVLRVLYYYSNTASIGYNSNTWITCPDLSATITLLNSNNKVLVQAIGHPAPYNDNDVYIKVLRNGVDASPLGTFGNVRGSGAANPGYGGGNYLGGISVNFLDTIGNTSLQTYTIQAYVNTTSTVSNGLYWNRTSSSTGPDSGSAISSITLWEIAG